MLKKILFATLAVAIVTFTAPAKAGEILIINMDGVYANSLAGKSLISQVQRKGEAIKNKRDNAQKELESIARKIEDQKNLLAPEALRAKADELRLKQISANQEIQTEIRKIEAGQANASAQILQTLSPILKDILDEKKASIVMERRSILIGSPDDDITAEAVKRLNSKLKSVKLDAPKQN